MVTPVLNKEALTKYKFLIHKQNVNSIPVTSHFILESKLSFAFANDKDSTIKSDRCDSFRHKNLSSTLYPKIQFCLGGHQRRFRSSHQAIHMRIYSH